MQLLSVCYFDNLVEVLFSMNNDKLVVFSFFIKLNIGQFGYGYTSIFSGRSLSIFGANPCIVTFFNTCRQAYKMARRNLIFF